MRCQWIVGWWSHKDGNIMSEICMKYETPIDWQTNLWTSSDVYYIWSHTFIWSQKIIWSQKFILAMNFCDSWSQKFIWSQLQSSKICFYEFVLSLFLWFTDWENASRNFTYEFMKLKIRRMKIATLFVLFVQCSHEWYTKSITEHIFCVNIIIIIYHIFIILVIDIQYIQGVIYKEQCLCFHICFCLIFLLIFSPQILWNDNFCWPSILFALHFFVG